MFLGRIANVCFLAVMLIFYQHVSLAVEAFTFDPPFELKHGYGETFSIASLSLDEDENGAKLYVFKTKGGEKGFVTPDKVLNHEELLDAMYPSRVAGKQEKQHAAKSYTSSSYSSGSGKVSGDSAASFNSSFDSIDPGVAANLINQMYGRVCEARIKGFFSKTLVIDWTSSTKMIHSVKVFAEIGSVKEQLYRGGIRYFQFPNDGGTYNVIDWKTGEKKSIPDRAPYYFSN